MTIWKTLPPFIHTFIIKDCIALTMDEAKANLNNEQLGFYKKILTQKRKEIKEKIEKEMNLVENH